MWIKINNTPVNIADIVNISPVIKITPELWDNPDWESGIECILRDMVINKFGFDDKKEIHTYFSSNDIFVFYISINTMVQRYLNHSYNGVGNTIRYIVSSMYETESAAQTALDYLLSEMNEIERNLINITI